MNELQSLAETILELSPEKMAEITADVEAGLGDRLWVPNFGPQTDAYFCEADELFYGGEAGGGKSDLIVGCALTEHERSLILRRFTDDAKELAERTMAITDTREGYNGQDLIYRHGKRTIDYGGCKEEGTKQRYKGKPHDLIGFDEVSDFLESQYRFIIAWNRSTNPDQRCRVIAAGNPPTEAEGLWVIQYWGPWLDPTHPNPAKQGELRWYTTGADGQDIEVDGPGPHLINGQWEKARSRTFIRSRLQDNPDLAQTDYDAVLSALPEDIRRAYKEGRFDASLRDNPHQVIPTSWVKAAQDRWLDYPPDGIPMCAIGADIAQGGQHNTVLAPRHDGWFAPLIAIPGRETPDGPTVAGRIVTERRHNAHIIIDMGGGYGGSAYDHLKGTIPTEYLHGHKGSSESLARTEDQQLKFYNKRAELQWRFREALDPGKYQGSPIALPPDSILVSDLTAVTFKTVRGPGGGMAIKLIPKDQLVKKLGRSPDRGDAVVMSWSKGPRASTHIGEWREDQRTGNMMGRRARPKVNMGPRHRRGTRR